MRNTAAALLSLALALFIVIPALGQRKGEPPYTEATFSYPSDPTRVLLQVTTGAMDMTIRSMTLYGDGRLDLEVRSGTQTVVSEYTRDLEPAEVEAMLRLAVDHGLAEWDGTRIRAHQLRERGGRGYLPPTDTTRATIVVALEDYRRGDYKVEHVEQLIRLQAPRFTSEFSPGIPELKGVADLVDLLDAEMLRAEGAKK